MASQRRRSQRLSQVSKRPVTSRHPPPPPPPHPLLAPLLSPFALHSIAQVKRLPNKAEFHLVAVVMSVGDVIHSTSKDGRAHQRCPLCVGDDSGRYFEVSTWGGKMRWRDAVQLGDLCLLRSLKVNRWLNTTKANAQFHSHLTILPAPRSNAGDRPMVGTNPDDSRRAFYLLPCPPPPWLQQRVNRLVQWVHTELMSLFYLRALPAPQRLPPPGEASLLPSPSAVVDPWALPLLPVARLLSSSLESGCYRLRCRVWRVVFPSLPFWAPAPGMTWAALPPWASLASLVYRGCPHCGRELHADRNGAFHSTCDGCLALDDSEIVASDEAPRQGSLHSHYYRPFHVLVRGCERDEDGGMDDGSQRSAGNDGEGGVWLTVHHAVACRFFANLPASIWVEEAPSPPPAAQPLPPVLPAPVERRRSKRLRAAPDGTDSEVDGEALDGAMAEADAAGDVAPFCQGWAEEPIARRFCEHPRCQWMGLLCSLLAADDEDEAGEMEGRGRGNWKGSVVGVGSGVEWTMWVDVRLDVDDNDEMENRRIALRDCSMR